mmetsp:Transcript_22970/g.55648  ORF Transcript_22970/g.55648 Transcript_22970/m.55648 type:complete len:886 (-) Transcript_22970:115-2772(-)
MNHAFLGKSDRDSLWQAGLNFVHLHGVTTTVCLVALILGCLVLLGTAIWAGLYYVLLGENPLEKSDEEVSRLNKKKWCRRQLALIAAEEAAERERALLAKRLGLDDERDPDAVMVDMRIAELEAKEMVLTTVSRVMPVIKKVDKMKSTIDNRMNAVKTGSMQLLATEVVGTATDVLDALEIKGANRLLKLDFNWKLPPAEIVIAGLFAPIQLQAFRWANWMAVVIFVGILTLLMWAALGDSIEMLRCDVVGLYVWVWLQLVACLVLVASRCILAGQTEINVQRLSVLREAQGVELQEILRKKRAGTLTDLEYVRHIILFLIARSGHELMLWDDIANSRLSYALFLAIAVFVAVGIYGFVLMLMYFFVPGKVSVVPGDGGLVCGAWRCVLALRIFCVIFAVFFMLFLVNLVTGLVCVLARNRRICLFVLRCTQLIDRFLGGFPMFSTFTKAFILRDSVEGLGLKNAEAEYRNATLQQKGKEIETEYERACREYEENQAELAELRAKIGAIPVHPKVKARIAAFQATYKSGLVDLQERVSGYFPRQEDIDPLQGSFDEHIETFADIATGIRSVREVEGLREYVEQADLAAAVAREQATKLGAQIAVVTGDAMTRAWAAAEERMPAAQLAMAYAQEQAIARFVAARDAAVDGSPELLAALRRAQSVAQDQMKQAQESAAESIAQAREQLQEAQTRIAEATPDMLAQVASEAQEHAQVAHAVAQGQLAEAHRAVQSGIPGAQDALLAAQQQAQGTLASAQHAASQVAEAHLAEARSVVAAAPDMDEIITALQSAQDAAAAQAADAMQLAQAHVVQAQAVAAAAGDSEALAAAQRQAAQAAEAARQVAAQNLALAEEVAASAQGPAAEQASEAVARARRLLEGMQAQPEA